MRLAEAGGKIALLNFCPSRCRIRGWRTSIGPLPDTRPLRSRSLPGATSL